MTYTKAEIYGNAALSHAQVRAVRLRRGENARVVAAAYGVAPDTIRKIWRGETYTMVPDEELLPASIVPVSREALEASLKRTLELAGLPPMPLGPASSLEEALKAQAEREAGGPTPGLDKLAAVSASLHRGDRLVEELAGHGNVAVVSLPIPPALPGTSTDGEAK